MEPQVEFVPRDEPIEQLLRHLRPRQSPLGRVLELVRRRPPPEGVSERDGHLVEALGRADDEELLGEPFGRDVVHRLRDIADVLAEPRRGQPASLAVAEVPVALREHVPIERHRHVAVFAVVRMHREHAVDRVAQDRHVALGAADLFVHAVPEVPDEHPHPLAFCRRELPPPFEGGAVRLLPDVERIGLFPEVPQIGGVHAPAAHRLVERVAVVLPEQVPQGETAGLLVMQEDEVWNPASHRAQSTLPAAGSDRWNSLPGSGGRSLASSIDKALERHPLNSGFEWKSAPGPFRRLSDDQVRQFDRDGYIVVDDLVDAATLEAVTQEIDRFEAKVDAFLKTQPDERMMIAEAGALTVTLHVAARSPVLRDL